MANRFQVIRVELKRRREEDKKKRNKIKRIEMYH